MENKVKVAIVSTTITGLILGAQVTISFENKLGSKPESVRGRAVVPDPSAVQNPSDAAPALGGPMSLPALLGTVEMTINASGEKNTTAIGKIPTVDAHALELALETELRASLA
jgi:hypothetical protein